MPMLAPRPCYLRAAPMGPEPSSPLIQQLQEKADREWPHLAAARRWAVETRERLHRLLRDQDPSDTSIVVFGSLARGEYTPQSDLDWTLLIDGQADETHYAQVQEISRRLAAEQFHEPGPTGLFGNVAFSHPIIHQIGGQDDTNKNTTQRILLLLESLAIGKDEAHERVLRLVLTRYVAEDRGLLFGSRKLFIPHILLNDIVRYWRTITVDFVAKQRERTGGWALRTIKLRLSRKLIFVSGLLTCFGCALRGERPVDAEDHIVVPEMVRFLRDQIRRTPLESLAEVLLRPAVQPATVRQLFDAYDDFIALLGDEDKRNHLKKLPADEIGRDPLFTEARKLGFRFQDGLDRLFFEEDDLLRMLIRKYGVF